MTINKFNEYLQTLPHIETQLVHLRYKYEWENEWTYSNEILTVDMNVEGYYCWLKDWNEGQQDVEILGCVALSDISVPYFISHECRCEMLQTEEKTPKAQEPRVMTLEEVVALPEGAGDVWIENTSMPGIPPWIIAATLTEKMDWQELGALWFSDDCCHYVADYNLDTADGWRCWTSRPTDEQREEVKWDGNA